MTLLKPFEINKDLRREGWRAGEDDIDAFVQELVTGGNLQDAAGHIFAAGAEYALTEMVGESILMVTPAGPDRDGEISIQPGDAEEWWINYKLADVLDALVSSISADSEAGPTALLLEEAAAKIRAG